MLGYVKCVPEEMLVKHHSLYRAAYCGLCRSVKANATRFLLPFFSDDFVFLALLRLAVSEDDIKTEKDFCLLHPFQRKHKRIADCSALKYAALVTLFFCCEKMQDELLDKDASLLRRLMIRFYLPILKRAEKKVLKKEPSLVLLSEKLSAILSEGRELETKNADLDAMCSNFASALSLVFSYGLSGETERIYSAMGDRLGRLLYTLDALDDLEKDEKSGAFNPILRRYRSAEKAKEHFPELDLVLSFYVQEIKLGVDLISGEKNFIAVSENVICHGLPGTVRRILRPKMGEEK